MTAKELAYIIWKLSCIKAYSQYVAQLAKSKCLNVCK